MICLHQVSKSYRVKGGRRDILRGLTFSFPADGNVAIIGRNGAGKSTLLRMIAGIIRPDHGRIMRRGRISWPLGFAGGLHPALTGRQNARFIARVYGADTDAMVAFVNEFSELGTFLDVPIEKYSTGMRARLAFAVSMAAEFDCYLVDEITAVGDAAFREKCRAAFESKLPDARMIMVSHSEQTLRDYCSSGLLLDAGQAWFFDDLEDALRAYRDLTQAR